MGIVDGKAVVITGAGRGIGRGHSLALGAEGAQVVVNDVDGEEAEKVAKEITAAGGRAVASSDDVGSRAGSEALIERCVAEFGRIDGLVSNAGIVRDRSFLKMSDEEFDDVWRIHVKGSFWCGQAAALRMREQGGGSIVNTASGALMGNFGQTNYGAAKGAIMSMTLTWAGELARYGIRVNAIAPMATTRMTGSAVGPDGKTNEDYFLDPNLNAPMVVYLLSDEGDWITGQVLAVGSERLGIMRQPVYGDTLLRDGGWTVEAVREKFKQNLGKKLEPFGLMKAPYAFYDGVKARS